MPTYNVYRSEGKSDIGLLSTPIITGLTNKNFVDNTVVKNKIYYYRISIVMDDGKEIFSDEITTYSSTFDELISSMSPLTWIKLDESSTSVTLVDSGSLNQIGTYTTPAGITPRGMVLRKGHAGAMGFGLSAESNARVSFVQKTEMLNLTKSSHTWLCYHYRTANTSQNRLWGDNGDGVDKRVISNSYQFPNNSRSLALSFPLNTIIFTAVVYDVETSTYKSFQNGIWTMSTYSSPPTSTSTSQSLHVPMTSLYGYYGTRGYISDLAFFDKALTLDQVESLYYAGKL